MSRKQKYLLQPGRWRQNSGNNTKQGEKLSNSIELNSLNPRAEHEAKRRKKESQQTELMKSQWLGSGKQKKYILRYCLSRL